MIDGRAAVVIFGGFENFCPINRNIIKINHSPKFATSSNMFLKVINSLCNYFEDYC